MRQKLFQKYFKAKIIVTFFFQIKELVHQCKELAYQCKELTYQCKELVCQCKELIHQCKELAYQFKELIHQYKELAYQCKVFIAQLLEESLFWIEILKKILFVTQPFVFFMTIRYRPKNFSYEKI